MTPELLSGIVGIGLSLALSYIPGLNSRWEGLPGDVKRAVIGLSLIATALTVYGLSCVQWVEIGLTCDRAGVIAVLKNLVAALIANQGIYTLTHK